MSSIQSSIGLVTGIPIQDTVNQLMGLAAKPRQNLIVRNRLLESEQIAIKKLTSLVLGLQLSSKKLESESTYESRNVSSSNTGALDASVKPNGSPATGNYTFTPVQTASTQQLLSQSVEDLTAPVGAGSFSFGFGGFVDKGISLSELNSGEGIVRGKIRITDRSGSDAVIDLSFAKSIDDVLEAINQNTEINVTAEVSGDSFKILDNTGQSISNLKVQEIGGGSTAASLGLSGIDESGTEATGADVFTLHSGTKLTTLNDGNGVQTRDEVDDLEFTLQDGTVLLVDLDGASTLGAVLEKINAADETKLTASINAAGTGINLTDSTSGGTTFEAKNVGTGTAATDLGLTQTASGGTLTGEVLHAGLKGTLLSSLQGGQGLDLSGSFQINNRSGVVSSVSFAGAKTLAEVVEAINGATGISAKINRSRNGIEITDTSAGGGNLTISGTSADALGLTVDAAADKTNSGSLGRQTISESTTLASLNGGNGVKNGTFKIKDSAGVESTIVLKVIVDGETDEVLTIGELIDKINEADANVLAKINDTGDGISLIDQADGPDQLQVSESSTSGTTAADLHLLGTGTTVDVNGINRSVLDGSTAYKIEISAEESLTEIIEKVNALGAGVTASSFNDGSGYRLSLSVEASGVTNEILLDTTESVFQFEEISSARDAIILYGSSENAGSGILVSSASNEFNEVIGGINLTVKEGSTAPVTITVSESSDTLVKAVEGFVKSFNAIRDHLDDTTDFDSEALSTGILFGTREVLRVETDLADLLGKKHFGLGKFSSLSQIGIKFNSKGKLELDKTQLKEAFTEDSAALKEFFGKKTSTTNEVTTVTNGVISTKEVTTEESIGFISKLTSMVDRLAGEEFSLLTLRTDTLQKKIETQTDRIERWDVRLERQREALLKNFYQLELTVGKLQASQTALGRISPLPPLTSVRR